MSAPAQPAEQSVVHDAPKPRTVSTTLSDLGDLFDDLPVELAVGAAIGAAFGVGALINLIGPAAGFSVALGCLVLLVGFAGGARVVIAWLDQQGDERGDE